MAAWSWRQTARERALTVTDADLNAAIDEALDVADRYVTG